jgi:Fe-S oxidoreductase
MKIGLWITCLVDLMRPRIGFATLNLVRATGHSIEIPEQQTCCGQPGFNSGDTSAGRAMAMQFLKHFESFDAVVLASGSCAAMIRHDYPRLFANQPEYQVRFQELGQRTFELSEFLLRHPFDLPPTTQRFSGRLTYHDSCSGLRTLGIRSGPRQLLQRIPGVEIVEMPDREVCCGFGGAFSVKLGDIATRMAENKCRSILATGVDAVVGGDLGCLLTIEGRLRREGHSLPVWHWAEVLAGTVT